MNRLRTPLSTVCFFAMLSTMAATADAQFSPGNGVYNYDYADGWRVDEPYGDFADGQEPGPYEGRYYDDFYYEDGYNDYDRQGDRLENAMYGSGYRGGYNSAAGGDNYYGETYRSVPYGSYYTDDQW